MSIVKSVKSLVLTDELLGVRVWSCGSSSWSGIGSFGNVFISIFVVSYLIHSVDRFDFAVDRLFFSNLVVVHVAGFLFSSRLGFEFSSHYRTSINFFFFFEKRNLLFLSRRPMETTTR